MPPKQIKTTKGGFGSKNQKWNRKPQEGRTMTDYLQRTLSVSLSDGRLLIGRFSAFDKHMNIVLSEAREYPNNANPILAAAGKEKNERKVGLVVVRGEHVVNVTAVKRGKASEPAENVKESDSAAAAAAAAASAVPGAAVAKSNVPQLPGKQSGARRQRVTENDD